MPSLEPALYFDLRNTPLQSVKTTLLDRIKPLINAADSRSCALILSIHTYMPHKASFFSTLSPQESKKSLAFTSHQSNETYILKKGLLRFILSTLLDTPPKDLTLINDGKGKPKLIHPERLEFNISHSQDYWAIALSKKHAVGIDIEVHRPITSIEKLSQRFFTQKETMLLDSEKDPNKKETLFFKLWTQKEALVKALGLGISYGLDRFEINPNTPHSTLTHCYDTALDKHSIRLEDLAIDIPNTSAAIAQFKT